MIIKDFLKNYLKKGLTFQDAKSRICQDIILNKISKSKYNSNITLKGGIIMYNISKDNRRVTKDLDMDFIRYSLSDESIHNFINNLNNVNDELKIKIKGKIEELKQQDYHGKRIYVEITDKMGYKLNSKLDIGVHNDLCIEQEEYCFLLNEINDSATLLVNSKEQIISEKLKALLKFKGISTRYKDILDIYFLITNTEINKDKLKIYIEKLIINDTLLIENNFEDITYSLKKLFKQKNYIKNFKTLKNNWLEIPIEIVTNEIVNFFEIMEEKISE